MHFKEDIIQAFYDGIKRKPEITFGNVKADVLTDKDSAFLPSISAVRFAVPLGAGDDAARVVENQRGPGR